MDKPVRPLKFSGMVPPGDQVHAAQDDPDKLIPPTYVEVPGGKYVAQYAPTVVGTSVAYNPPGNCDGNFMSCKFQPNNNCYNYSTNVATNSFAQPGRMHGLFLDFPPSGEQVVQGAEMDGLVLVGTADMPVTALTPPSTPGHYVALLISAAYNQKQTGWVGDYHWVRCNAVDTFNSWSQKDGGDQVTNFDFAGNLITDPATANWTVNQGPISGTPDYPDDVIAAYDFYAWMFVPQGGVSII